MSNSLKRFKKLPSKSSEVNQIQSNIEEAVNPIINSNIVDGVLLRNLKLCALQANLVTHKLGRPPLGWIVVRQRADSRIWDIQDDNILKKTTLALTCSHEVEVDLWIF
jgi:hypothetical protein